ncbi:hypothetical protein [Micromonospora fluostatini]|uniref:hypothetical protein n=1 Tax=Micromonospora sp. JCM 30529 TaxID=3421643 RepID=UPI003D16BFB2
MAAGKRSGQARRPATKPAHSGLTTVGLALVTVLVVGACVVGIVRRDDGSTRVPAPTAAERDDTVPILARAAEQHGLCYGWRLSDSSTEVVSVGSNVGVGIGVEENPQCPRWVQVEARVTYTSASSELDDSAFVTVTTSPDLDRTRLVGLRTRLERFGLTREVFVDDPGWAVTRAATVLPLLVAEAGVVEPLATTAPVPADQVPPLAAAGSDLWRDRWGQLLTVAGLLLVAVLLVVVGLVQRSRQRRAAAGPADRTAPGQGPPAPGHRPPGPGRRPPARGRVAPRRRR